MKRDGGDMDSETYLAEDYIQALKLAMDGIYADLDDARPGLRKITRTPADSQPEETTT